MIYSPFCYIYILLFLELKFNINSKKLNSTLDGIQNEGYYNNRKVQIN